MSLGVNRLHCLRLCDVDVAGITMLSSNSCRWGSLCSKQVSGGQACPCSKSTQLFPVILLSPWRHGSLLLTGLLELPEKLLRQAPVAPAHSLRTGTRTKLAQGVDQNRPRPSFQKSGVMLCCCKPDIDQSKDFNTNCCALFEEYMMRMR